MDDAAENRLMTVPIRDEYAARRDRWATAAERLAVRDGRIAAVRGLSFLAAAAVAGSCWATGRPAFVWTAIPAAAFVAAVLAHQLVLKPAARARRAVSFYDRGLDRLDGRWDGEGHTGERYHDHAHPYADDLDLFGDDSLFQRLCRCRTRLGQDRLAAWLLTPASRGDVAARQMAVDELRGRLDLREEAALLDAEGGAGNQNLLRAWAGIPARPLSSAVRIATVGFSAAFWGCLAAWWAGELPLSLPVAVYAACLLLVFFQRGRVAEAAGRIERADAGLATLAAILGIVERQSFDSPALQGVTARLATGGRPASERIAGLHRLSHRFEAATRNQFFAPIAVALGLPIHLAHAAELWRERFGRAIPGWLDAVADFEATLSLAGYAAEHPDDPWPEIAADGPIFEGRGVGHPLLPPERCVRNDVTLGEPLRLIVVSGSNMAGKSTLLRAIGANVVLALAGAPVRAKSLRVSVVQVGTLIRVTDSLRSGKSFFFTAVERLRDLLRLAEQDRPLLFLLDELLAGTNSHDRRIGAEAVLRRLLDAGACGLLTTHDLALAEIADGLGDRAANAHLRDTVVGGELRFDYTLRPGVIDRGNALAIMRSLGLIPAEGEGARSPRA